MREGGEREGEAAVAGAAAVAGWGRGALFAGGGSWQALVLQALGLPPCSWLGQLAQMAGVQSARISA